MQYTEAEREIDLKQLFLVICGRWGLLLACMIAGLAAGVIYGTLKTSAQVSANSADAEAYEAAVAAYEEQMLIYEAEIGQREQWLSQYRYWAEEAYAMLEAGIPSDIPEGQTKIEVADNALKLLQTLQTMNTTKKNLENEDPPARPEAPAEAVADAGTGIVRKGAIGLFAGLFIGLFALALYEILRGRILSSEEMNSRYGLRSVGVLATDRAPEKRLKQFGADHYHLQMTKEEQLEAAASNLSVYAPGEKEILLVGSVDGARLKALADLFAKQMPDITFSTAPHILSNVASLQTLKDHTQVILVEQAFRSVYKDVDREMQLLHDRKIQVAGSVTLY